MAKVSGENESLVSMPFFTGIKNGGGGVSVLLLLLFFVLLLLLL